MLTENDIINLLPPELAVKKNVLVYDSLESTNDKAKEHARDGAPSGTIVVARSQTAGRGRLGRSFFSPEGEGLYMTALYCPDVSAGELMTLTAFASVAVCDAIEVVAGARPRSKWPNDIVAGGKKLCGILTELSLDPSGGVRSAVIGIGVNVGHSAFPPELEETASSLKLEYGFAPPLAGVCAAIAERLDEAVPACIGEARGEWLRKYKADCLTIGKRVALARGKTVRNGTAAGIDDNAALIVSFDDGTVEAVSSGEVLQHGV